MATETPVAKVTAVLP
jgi:hypothetical protein